jgi:hypothetical protein
MLRVLKGALFSVSFCFTAGTAYSETYCTDHDSANDLLTAARTGGGYDECIATPQEVEFTVYDISMCTSEPDVGSVGSCTSIFSSTSGKEVLVSESTSVSLDPAISLENGDYTYVALTLDIRVGVKVAFDLGFNTGLMNGWNSTSGEYCWSNGSDIDSYGVNRGNLGNVRCGSLQESLSQAAMSYENINVFDDLTGTTNTLNDEPSGNNTTFDIDLLDSAGQRASIVPDPTTGVYADADKLFVIIELPSAQRVNETSSNIDVGFKVSDLVLMKLAQTGDASRNCSGPICFQNASVRGVSFYATVR